MQKMHILKNQRWNTKKITYKTVEARAWAELAHSLFGEKTMKMIEIKEGNKTKYRLVPDNYKEPERDIPQRDLTTGGATLISMDMTEEQYNRIFKKGLDNNKKK